MCKSGAKGAARRAPAAGARPPERELIVCVAIAVSLIVAGGLVAAVDSAAPFAHGSWLAAYLVLVGGVAQLALGLGPLLFPAPVLSPSSSRTRLVLWNLGTGIVAAGVFAASTAVVVSGSVLVLGALACFARGAGPAREPGRERVLAYRLVVAVLAVSVVIGIALSGGGASG
ncbi:MAG: hypothetical protein JST08_09695 [Actinobacteria bacterium]|nr:hypothetical protein [Actinomycetota bacterium]